MPRRSNATGRGRACRGDDPKEHAGTLQTETDWIGAEDAGSTPSNLIRSNSELPMLMPRIPDRGRHLVALNQRQEHPRRNVDETLLIILNPAKLQNLQETSES